MVRFSQVACCLLALLLASSAVVAQNSQTTFERMPNRGDVGAIVSQGPDISLPGVFPSSVAKIIRANRPKRILLRGVKEATIFEENAPAVVLVATNDGFGSGSIISAEGEILTNWHVVEGYDDVSVIFYPDTPMPREGDYIVVSAEVMSADKSRDLAVIRLNSAPPASAQVMRFGSLENLRVGDDAHAIGHPEGLNWTYSKGYISSLRSSFEWSTEDGGEYLADVIQTQTPINPGNSGGPLLDDSGNMIGVNSFIREGEALNFAVSIDEVRRFLEERHAVPDVCKIEVLFEGRNADNFADLKMLDTNCDGIEDITLYEPDDSNEPIVVLFDQDQNGEPDGYVFDDNRDGNWDDSYWDTTGDGETDTKGFHPDGGINPSSYESLS